MRIAAKKVESVRSGRMSPRKADKAPECEIELHRLRRTAALGKDMSEDAAHHFAAERKVVVR